jgi:hypothetical protein
MFVPGIRWHQAEGRAIHFGFTALYAGGEFVPIPIPMVQWFRTF